MNNKGFMMAEVIVVSAIVLVTLTGMYISYSKIFTLYNQRINYYDVSTLYELAYIRDNRLEGLNFNSTNNVDADGDGDDDDIVYYVDKNTVKNKTISKDDLKVTFKEYLDYLSTSVDFDNMKVNGVVVDNILIMENCSDENNCKYAYLEVLND